MSDPYEKAPERQGMPGKTPGQAEGGADDDRPMPYPTSPGKTPGSAEGPDISTDPVPGERSPNPNRYDQNG